MPKAKNVEEYIAMQRTGVASNPDCGTSHYNLAVGLMGQKKYNEAEKELHAAIDCSPSLAEAYVQLGGICLQRGDLDGCLEYNKRATKARAGFFEGYGNMGFVHLQRGEAEEAIAALKKALTFNSRFIQAHSTLASAYLMSGLIDESLKANLKVIELDPNFAIAYNNLAIAYLEKGEYNKAVENCDKATKFGYEVDPGILKEIESHR